LSVKYVKPVYAKTANDKSLEDKVNDAASIYNNEGISYDGDGSNYRKAIYEVTEDRINQELATAPKVGEAGDNFKTGTTDDGKATVTFTFAEKDGKWGDNGEKLLKGYTVVYYGTNENDVVAIETSRAVNGSTAFAIVDNETFESVKWGTVESGPNKDSHVLTVTLKEGKTLGDKKLNCFARFDSENDFDGDYLGEVEIKMYDYQFEPRPTSIGVSWSQLSEIELDTSFNLSAEEYLVTYAAQAIKVALDYKAIRLAYQQAKLNKKYHVEFDAAYSTNKIAVSNGQSFVDNAGTKDGYVANAQTIGLAIETVGDNMLNDINRGGVTRIVCGPSAGTYLRLAGGFTAKGANIGQEGVKQIGTFEGIPVFKAPASIIPTDEMLTVYKNVNNESDIGIAFGTLIPFFSTGMKLYELYPFTVM
jgi:hypothetical protein